MRVSPSGKAVASQATMRGFESHHPLYHNPILIQKTDRQVCFDLSMKIQELILLMISQT